MKYALVTGSTKGIGYAIAEKLSENGYYVFINGRYDTAKINLRQDTYTYVKADMSTLEGVKILTGAVLAKTQVLDCLVLNVGATCRKAISDIEYTDWQRIMDTNVNMPFFLIQRLFPYITYGGSVIFISSAMSQKPHATSIPYGVSKAAVNMLAQTLVKEFSPKGIRVNAICPGFIETGWQKDKPEGQRGNIINKIALGRFGTPEEVADMCLCLIQSSYINGAIIPVDGGYDFE